MSGGRSVAPARTIPTLTVAATAPGFATASTAVRPWATPACASSACRTATGLPISVATPSPTLSLE